MIEALQDSRRDSSCDELWNDSEDAGKSSGAAETMAQTGRRGGGRRAAAPGHVISGASEFFTAFFSPAGTT